MATADWVTLDKFEEMTGVNREFVRKSCRDGDWPEAEAWDKLSERVYLINLVWWNKWRETEAESKRRRLQQSKSSLCITAKSAVNASSSSPAPLI